MKKQFFFALNFIFFLTYNCIGTPVLLPDHLTCEYRTNPLGIDVLRPRLCWTMASTEANQLQTAYEIIVQGNNIVLDSKIYKTIYYEIEY